jgi:hypothetical protein
MARAEAASDGAGGRAVSDTPELGADIAGYRLESVLGAGGMGIVYLARGPQGGICALKVLPRRLLGDDPTFATRFKREAQYAEALDHPNVVELYEAGEAPDGTLYIAMQYVDGPDLGVLIRRDGAFSLPVALSILAQVGDALDSAHATGLVHRDVKPANIIVADDPGGPQAYLADFGLSKNRTQDSIALTKLGQLIGTMSYTAPEEIMSTEPRDHRVDIYSLGCVLYEAVVGKPPFVRERDIELLYAHVGNPRPSAIAARPDLPPGFDEVIAKAMAISPDDRYSSCHELIAAVRALVLGQEEELEMGLDEPDRAGAAPVAPAAVSGQDQAANPVMSAQGPEEVGVPLPALVLAVRSGLGHGLEVTVEDEIVLGRLVTLDGVLAPDHSISRRHARITSAEDGGFVVEDEHSRNGTFLNDERIETPQPLRAGDLLKIGSTIFLARVLDAPAESATDAPPDRVEPPQAESAAAAPADCFEAPQAEDGTDTPAEWFETPQAESGTDASADWVETPQAESGPDAPADWVESPQAESSADAPADWVETPQAESATDTPADWVETPQAEGATDEPADGIEAPPPEGAANAPADSVEAPQAESGADAPAEWVETPQAESAADTPAEWVEAPQAESTPGASPEIETPEAESAADDPAEWIEAPQAGSATAGPADWVESPQPESPIDTPAEIPHAESASDTPADSLQAPEAESATGTPEDAVEIPHAESATDAPADRIEAAQVSEVVLEGREPGSRLALRLEYDLEAGELIVAIENGASVRLVREGAEWYVESE